MSYDPTQRVPPPQGNPPPGYTRQGFPPQAYPSSQPGYPPGYPQPQPPAAAYPQFAAAPAGAAAGPGFNWQTLGLNGKAALVIGALTLILFFLPWYASPDPNGTVTYTSTGNQSATLTISNTVTHPGFSAASGVEDPSFNKSAGQSGNSFSYKTDGSAPSTITLALSLWLVPLGALALMGVGWFLSQRRISSRLATILLIAISAVSLAMELSFVVAINSLESDTEHNDTSSSIHLASTVYAVSWGAWLAVVVAAAGVCAGIYIWMQERKALNPALVGAQPYGGQYPGAPPAYPG